MFKVIAVDAANRPNEIPTSKWIEKDEVYTVTEMAYMNIQNKLLGFKLEEINIDDCFPYQFFAARRFRPLTEDDVMAAEKVEELLLQELIEV